MGNNDQFSARPIPALHGPASRVRYGVLAFLCALAFILYIDRICINKAAPHIMAELDISKTAMGVVFSAFTLAYGLFEIPTGRWGDRYGSRGVLTRIVLWWSAFTALTGGAIGYYMLLGVRFLFGAGEAGAFPNTARVLARWFPAASRGRAQGLVNTSALLGGAVAPIAAETVIQLASWRWAFVLFGLLGVVWAAAFYAWFRDDPAEHPAVNEAEQRLIAAGRLETGGAAHPPVPWGLVLTSANVWLLGGVITCSAFSTYLYFTWFPTYLEKARGVDPWLSGWLASLVLAGGALGCLTGGVVKDGLLRLTGERRWTSRCIGYGGLTGAALALVASIHFDAPLAAAGCAALANFSVCSVLPTWWSAVIDISGRHVGALFGLLNSLGVPGAVASPLFLGRFADWMGQQGYTGRAQWDPAFYVYAGVLMTGAIGWLFIDATRSVVEEADGEDSTAIKPARSG